MAQRGARAESRSRLLPSLLRLVAKRLTALLFDLLIRSSLVMPLTVFMPLLIRQTPARIRCLCQAVTQMTENRGTAWIEQQLLGTFAPALLTVIRPTASPLLKGT